MIYNDLKSCKICPRDCAVNRYEEKGFCQASAELKINLAQLHFGEEPPISGRRGSGTIFFSHCNLRCVYCQNHQISLQGYGQKVSEEELCRMMLGLQSRGAHNINLVTPTHYTVQLRSVLQKAKAEGLEIPILWNSSAYEKVETLKSLEGLVDIYLPDYKYHDPGPAGKYSHAADYPQIALEALGEMHRQTGFLSLDDEGIAQRGVLVRILVLPNGLSGTEAALRNLAEIFGPQLHLSLMGQYYPAGDALSYPQISRGINMDEYQKVLDAIHDLGFKNVFSQELSCDDSWTPKFRRDDR